MDEFETFMRGLEDGDTIRVKVSGPREFLLNGETVSLKTVTMTDQFRTTVYRYEEKNND